MTTCRICGNSGQNTIFEAREMMYGYRDIFRYFQCKLCNCLQIENPPSDISAFYPGNYYSYKPLRKKFTIIKEAERLRNKHAIKGNSLVGRAIYWVYPNRLLQQLSPLLSEPNKKILDVGCGSGAFLFSLREAGFGKTYGIDPYIPDSIQHKNGLRISKQELKSVKGNFDLIIFKHSFEHIFDQINTLKLASNLLNYGGHCLIGVPIVSSYAWEHYNVNWVQLDAPRHFYLHSLESMNILAEKCKLKIDRIIHNSKSLQFWGSEQYLQDIPLKSEKSYDTNPKKSIFSKKDIASFNKRAAELNDAQQGDSVFFILKKTKCG
jgi:SAM-dependent methyltransferase